MKFGEKGQKEGLFQIKFVGKRALLRLLIQ